MIGVLINYEGSIYYFFMEDMILMSDFILLNWPKLLFLAIFVPLILVPLIRVLFLSGQKHRNAMETLQKYLQTKRPRLLAEQFPECTWQEPHDYTTLTKDFYQSYEFRMQRSFPENTITLMHQLSRSAQYYGRDDTDYKWVYYNHYQLAASGESSLQPRLSGFFQTMSHAFSPLRGAEKLADLIGDPERMAAYRQAKTSDVVRLGTAGQLCYEHIPCEEWNAFVSNGVLNKMEQLLIIWKGFGKVSLLYQDHALTFTITDTAVYNQPYQCLQADFLIEHADRFRQSTELLSTIYECMIHFM